MVTQGVERAGQGATVEDAAVAAAARSRASLDRAPDRTGCDATGHGMVTGIGRSALWRGVCPWAVGSKIPLYAHGSDLPRPGFAALLLAAGGDVGRSWLAWVECRSHPRP
jgi:hypothetical protein